MGYDRFPNHNYSKHDFPDIMVFGGDKVPVYELSEFSLLAKDDLPVGLAIVLPNDIPAAADNNENNRKRVVLSMSTYQDMDILLGEIDMKKKKVRVLPPPLPSDVDKPLFPLFQWQARPYWWLVLWFFCSKTISNDIINESCKSVISLVKDSLTSRPVISVFSSPTFVVFGGK